VVTPLIATFVGCWSYFWRVVEPLRLLLPVLPPGWLDISGVFNRAAQCKKVWMEESNFVFSSRLLQFDRLAG
jgi:hypothetical protein